MNGNSWEDWGLVLLSIGYCASMAVRADSDKYSQKAAFFRSMHSCVPLQLRSVNVNWVEDRDQHHHAFASTAMAALRPFMAMTLPPG